MPTYIRSTAVAQASFPNKDLGCSFHASPMRIKNFLLYFSQLRLDFYTMFFIVKLVVHLKFNLAHTFRKTQGVRRS